MEKLRTPILTVKTPWGVAINQRGEVVVTEGGACRVSVFSVGGEELRSFGSRGSAQGQFEHPFGVAVDGEGNILVADNGNHCIQKFTSEGQFLTAVGTKGSGHLQFNYPKGIAFNRLYVTEGDRVQILHSGLTFSSTFGKLDKRYGQFDGPYDIACDSSGKVYVADYNNHRVQVLTANGEFLKIFGKLSWPVGIAVDSNDMVYVSELGNRVSVFTPEGVRVTSLGSAGQQPAYPQGLCVDNSGIVYVCDVYNHLVQIH